MGDKDLIGAETRAYALFELNPDAVFIVDPDGVIVDVNAATERTAGRRRDEILGQHFEAFFSQENLKVAAETFEAVRAGHAVLHQTVTITRPDGTDVVLDVTAHPTLAGGEVVAICGIARDVTERVRERERLRRSEQALRESENLLRQLTENINQVFYLSEREAASLLYVSPQFEELFGMPADKVLNDRTAWREAVHPEDRPRMEQVAESNPDGFDVEYRIVRPDGSVRWIRAKGFPVLNAKGEVARIAGIAEDVTDQKLLAEQLRQAQKMESVGQLAGGVAHDFNNLLLVILNAARFIEEEVDKDDPVRQDLELITSAVERGASLVRQLLAFARKQIVDPKMVDINGVIDEMEALLRRTVGEKVEVLFNKERNLSLTKIDPNQLGQVLVNLMVNAGDSMSNGGTVSIETRNVSLSEDLDADIEVLPAGDYVCISVSDTGCGIDKDVLPRIFEPFFSTKSKAEATGLGLSMVYGIVTQAGGKVSVYSEAGIGTTFKLYLPAAEGTLDAEERVRPRRRVAGEGRVVLVAEDDQRVSTAVARMLQRAGFKVLHARSGDAALKIGRDHDGRIDLLLADVVMPGMSGRELGVHVRALSPETKILYMSGYSEDMIGRHGILQVGENYLQKPFTSDDLIGKVDQLLTSSSARPRR